MKRESVFSLKVFIWCLIIVGALVAALYFEQLNGYRDVLPYMTPLPFVFGLGGVAVILLWLLIHLTGRSAVQKPAAPQPARKEKAVAREPVKEAPQSPAPALQILGILQRQGRFIDFIQEDLSSYSDEQVGAAVRNVHQGCRDALLQHLELKPVMSEEEGAPVTIQPGFDLHSIRLSGNVSGDPPFKGTLRHHGWRVVRVDLPKQVRDQEKDWVIAPAEVEV